jgi:hypothetical protein
MTDTNITCPKCGAEIPLTEAVSHGLREELVAQFEKERNEASEALKRREERLASETASLDKRANDVEAEVKKQVETERKKLMENAAKKAEEKLGAEMKGIQDELDEKKEKLAAATAAQLNLLKEKRELEEAKAGLELEVALKLDAERKKIADEARQQGAEAERLKVADKDNVIKGLQGKIAELQQRAEQGSMQLQGETLELELEQQLRSTFPFDEISEVSKGLRGADIVHRIRTNHGIDCGTILWEAKRAKNWGGDWPEKLKADQREAKAEIAVIVTTCPPDTARGIAQVEGVWVCEPPFAVGLAAALRQGLISTAVMRTQQAGRSDKMAALYDHLCSVEFRQHIEALVESFLGLKEQLDSEQRAYARQWKEREQQLKKAITHTAMLYGGIQGIAGREALPAIEKLELPA